ncbi:MAG: HpcH/HpaI aldolase/citrate lyase family protein [Ignavibacteriales bacterium]|nr:HpcH/HpaI aldolase/citrate lyase family protein [Ignavibacteriales bacterium]MCF8314747.1 HpcH/HpaI aldolase/citrate lyase family protein [Ignavibacteriales bacterium]MCF8438005.1 HpcH/HpaI aldolase/citrate lyase family protein [Ignavibacteriales bacterium]
MNKTGYAGKKGDKIRSDCYISITENGLENNSLQIKSKVSPMYGENIESQMYDLIQKAGIKGVDIVINDYGALPFVIAARFESALRRYDPAYKTELLPLKNNNLRGNTAKDRRRRSRLYLPGNEPKFFPNAGLHGPDGIILDLEDSVSPAEKDSALLLVRNALISTDFYSAERMVRINQLPKGLTELPFLLPHNIDVVLLPKCESEDDVNSISTFIEEFCITNGIDRRPWVMPIIESAKGVLNAYKIATASELVCSLAVGLEDYTADIGTKRTNEGNESFFARSMILNAAKAAGIQAIDTVFSDVADMSALKESVLEAKSLGYEGKGCIHPRQIPVIHEAFAPERTEVDKAMKIVAAFEKARTEGSGVVSLGSKMIDMPVVKRALRLINNAVADGMIPADWNSEKVDKG